jgi:hypothetical protein
MMTEQTGEDLKHSMSRLQVFAGRAILALESGEMNNLRDQLRWLCSEFPTIQHIHEILKKVQ